MRMKEHGATRNGSFSVSGRIWSSQDRSRLKRTTGLTWQLEARSFRLVEIGNRHIISKNLNRYSGLFFMFCLRWWGDVAAVRWLELIKNQPLRPRNPLGLFLNAGVEGSVKLKKKKKNFLFLFSVFDCFYKNDIYNI